jgi:acylaminoacyl-peptidase
MLVGPSNRQLPCCGCLVYVCSPDGKLLVFLSSQAAVNTGAHSATNSLHSIDWPANGSLGPHMQIRDVVPVVQHAEEGGFPGLYCSNLISNPWLPDNCTLLLSSAWRSQQVILGVNILRCFCLQHG